MCTVLDPFTHCLVTVPVYDIFSVLDLTLLAEQGSITEIDQKSEPKIQEDDVFPWTETEDMWTVQLPASSKGFSLPSLSHQTWLDRLILNSEKYKY